jgi:hypothetical protein
MSERKTGKQKERAIGVKKSPRSPRKLGGSAANHKSKGTTGTGSRAVPPGDDPSGPKTTRPSAPDRRAPEPAVSTAEAIDHTFDAMPDRVDARDWFYRPGLAPLPDQVVNCDRVGGDDAILNQGAEGACTGFALAGVINYLHRARNMARQVSPRMLYEMARRYDEWPGEAYEGSSARGAMKGWIAHGVCEAALWTPQMKGVSHFFKEPEVADSARKTPGGAFYRVAHREVRDVHAALNEVGILYMTLMVHKGWFAPEPQKNRLAYVESGTLRSREMPVIRRQGTADGGHAVAIVGYTAQGFIIQNSWGPTWGAGGFALLPYEDYLIHATDVWVAQVGVPLDMDLWTEQGHADTTAGMARAVGSIPLADIRPYVIDVGNNGRLSDSGNYWTSPDDVDELFRTTIPEATRGWDKRRVLLYLHGGLNDEKAVAQRVVAFRDVMLANQIYPVHLMWETGAMESIKDILGDYLGVGAPRAAGVAEWLEKTRQGLVEAKDRTFELTVAGPGAAIWSEMKENAARASNRTDPLAVSNVVAAAVAKALAGATGPGEWELHVVGHSAGSIFAAYAMSHLVELGIPLKTLQFMAPAITTDLFKERVVPHVEAGDCPHPTMYILSDVGERDDTVGPYGKSLLYLVSNALEGRRDTPILGMERVVNVLRDRDGKQTNEKTFDSEIHEFFAANAGPWKSLVVAGYGPKDRGGDEAVSPESSRSSSHGGFDNDEWTMNAVLFRILGAAPARPFTLRDLQY